MSQYVYWHAPLWEVLLVALISLVLLGWLVVRALRRPELSVALSAINPALGGQPLFFFDRATGIRSLNDAAQEILDNLPTSERRFLMDVLMETLLEAYEEARITWQRGWPDADSVLMAAPIYRQPGDVTGVLALVTEEGPLPPAERLVEEHLSADRQAWLALGPALRLHRSRPVVHVRRLSSTTTGETTITWQEHQLSHAEDALLRYLLEHQAEVQTSETLFRVVWPDEEVDRYGLRPDQRDRLRRLIYQLRQHVEPDPHHPHHVCTAHGVGYVLYLEQEAAVQ